MNIVVQNMGFCCKQTWSCVLALLALPDQGTLVSLNLSFFNCKNRIIKITLGCLVYRAVVMAKGNNSRKELKLGAWHRR